MEVLSPTHWRPPASPSNRPGPSPAATLHPIIQEAGYSRQATSASASVLPRLPSLDVESTAMSGSGPYHYYAQTQGDRISEAAYREDGGAINQLDLHATSSNRQPAYIHSYHHEASAAQHAAHSQFGMEQALPASFQRTNTAPEQPEQRTPRPPNAWILYRSQKFRELQQSKDPQTRSANTGKSKSQAEISRIISAMWQNESAAVRREFEALADEKKLEHQRMYPTYRYRPRKRVKDTARAAMQQEQAGQQAAAAAAAAVASSSKMDGAHRHHASSASHSHLYMPYDVAARDGYARQSHQGLRRYDPSVLASELAQSHWDRRKLPDEMARRSAYGLVQGGDVGAGSELVVAAGSSSSPYFAATVPAASQPPNGRFQGSGSGEVGPSVLPSNYLRSPHVEMPAGGSHYVYVQGRFVNTPSGLVNWQGEGALSATSETSRELQTPGSHYTSLSDGDTGRGRGAATAPLDGARASPSMHLAGMPDRGQQQPQQLDLHHHHHHHHHAQPQSQQQQHQRSNAASPVPGPAGSNYGHHHDTQQFRHGSGSSYLSNQPIYSEFSGPGAGGTSSSSQVASMHDGGALASREGEGSSELGQNRRSMYFNHNHNTHNSGGGAGGTGSSSNDLS